MACASRRGVAVLLLALLVAWAAGCSDDDSDPSDDASTTTTSSVPDDVGVDGGDDPDDGETAEPDDDGGQAGTDPLPPLPDHIALPIVFVHGFAGSAQQYESQAMRFVANGYPQDRIVAYEHDGAGFDIAGYTDGLEAFVDATLAEHGVERIYLVGHSRGTAVSLGFLTRPGRTEQVAKLVLIDGAPCPVPAEVVELRDPPCLSPNQAMFPGQAHVEVATSAESFAAQFEFLVGEAPEVVEIVPQRAPVVLEGRAVDSPSNVGREATLDIWAVDPDSGHRLDDAPHATFELGPSGEFGPVEVEVGAHYEFALSSADTPVVHHLYLQPYLRSTHFVRLLTSRPDGATRQNTHTGDAHSALVVMRMREWYAVGRGAEVGATPDELLVSTVLADGTATEEVDVMGEFVGNGAIGLHLHDGAESPGESTFTPLPYFSEQPFQGGVDVFMPASPDADGTIRVTVVPRGDRARPQTVNVANWPSSGHSISVVFADHLVD